VNSERNAVRTEAARAAPVKPAIYGPATTQPAVPSVFGYAASYKHAA
jgi:hypothetical protein